jgi:hypothetical protein
MGYEQPVCEQSLQEHGNVPICPAVHCQEIEESKNYHEVCAEKAIYTPVLSAYCLNVRTGEWKTGLPSEEVAEVCQQLNEQDRDWKLKKCFCCCACMARDTPIALPDGISLAIGDIQAGDVVLAGSLAGSKVSWGEANVSFSQGTLGGEQPSMVYLVFGEGRRLIVTTDQVMALADGTLTTADRIHPGVQLLGVDGEPVLVTLSSLGPYTGGVHHISTSLEWNGSIDGHLLSANGVVVGDYVLQVNFPALEGEQKAAGHDEMPEIGTTEYVAGRGIVQIGDSLTYGLVSADSEVPSGEGFSAYPQQVEPIPAGASSFVTEAQAEDILANGVQQPPTDRSGYGVAQAAVALIGGFYRETVFYIDWMREEPNVYAFEQYGEQIVVVSGGLARMRGVTFEGLAMAIAHAVGSLAAGKPQTGSGLACTGVADMYAFGVVSQKIWFGEAWLEMCENAIANLKTLFALISPENAQGNSLNVCGEPAIACREKAWFSALTGGQLPECAGGPAHPPLQLEQASVSGSEVTLVFSAPPQPAEAENVANYAFTPALRVAKATVDQAETFRVVLELAAAPAEGRYTVSASNLKSTLGGKLTPDPATAAFDVDK